MVDRLAPGIEALWLMRIDGEAADLARPAPAVGRLAPRLAEILADPDAVAARDDDGQRVVGMCAVAVLQIDRTRGGCLVLHEIHLG